MSKISTVDLLLAVQFQSKDTSFFLYFFHPPCWRIVQGVKKWFWDLFFHIIMTASSWILHISIFMKFGTLKVVSRTPSTKKISTTKQGGLSVNFNLYHIDERVEFRSIYRIFTLVQYIYKEVHYWSAFKTMFKQTDPINTLWNLF